MSEPSKAVFLSYASQDAEAARRIAESLRAAGVEVWFDQNELVGGDAWDTKIRKQIQSCALFVPIISANTQARREAYFRLEWKLAEDRSHLMAWGTPFILPVVIDEVSDRGALVPETFLSVQWTRLAAGNAQEALAARIKQLLGVAVAPAAKSPTANVAQASSASGSANERSVAVLAFANLSSDKDNEYFSDGISEELLNVLAKVPDLKVTARTSAFHFKGKDTPIPEIARQLGVAYVVEGSVRKMGNRVRITAQLIKAADGFHIWSENFDRELQDIFAVQDEIAGLIAKTLQLKLGASAPARTVDPEAHRLALQGRAIFNREVPQDYPKAIECLKESLRIDPESAVNWAWLSEIYGVSGGMGALPAETGFEQAREAAARSIELDPELGLGYARMGTVHIFYDWDWVRAEAALQRAVKLTPGDSATLSIRSSLELMLGRKKEAVELALRALELDPLNSMAGYIYGKNLLWAGECVELEKLGHHLVALHPAGYTGLMFVALARLMLGRIDEAAAVAEQMNHPFRRLSCLGLIRHAQGRAAESDAVLSEMKSVFGVNGGFQIAEIHAFRNEPDQAFEWLEKSHEESDGGIAGVKIDPFLKNLHADPRWPAFLRKLNLHDDQIR